MFSTDLSLLLLLLPLLLLLLPLLLLLLLAGCLSWLVLLRLPAG
jgi:hypothetical protein